jgi:hypothetical protein
VGTVVSAENRQKRAIFCGTGHAHRVMRFARPLHSQAPRQAAVRPGRRFIFRRYHHRKCSSPSSSPPATPSRKHLVGSRRRTCSRRACARWRATSARSGLATSRAWSRTRPASATRPCTRCSARRRPRKRRISRSARSIAGSPRSPNCAAPARRRLAKTCSVHCSRSRPRPSSRSWRRYSSARCATARSTAWSSRRSRRRPTSTPRSCAARTCSPAISARSRRPRSTAVPPKSVASGSRCSGR